jgi:hypothetical protein
MTPSIASYSTRLPSSVRTEAPTAAAAFYHDNQEGLDLDLGAVVLLRSSLFLATVGYIDPDLVMEG